MDIIHYLLQLIQYLYQQNCWLINFICRYIPLRQCKNNKTMVRRVRSSVKSVLRGFLLLKATSPALSFAVPTAAMHLLQRKTAGTLSSINA